MTNETQNRQALPIAPPDLAAILDRKKRETLAEMNCMLIGKIVSFDAEEQTAKVSVNFKKIFSYQSSGAGQPMVDKALDYPALLRCPVVVLGGGAGSLQFPIDTGDTCLVFFHDRDMDAWFSTGNVTVPNSDRLHDLSDGIALVGIRSAADPLVEYATDRVRLRHGDAAVELKDGEYASLASADATVSAEDRVLVSAGDTTLLEALTALVNALTAAVTTGGQAFNPATIAALQDALAQIATVLK